MGDVPGLGLSFAPYGAPRWFCPESDEEEEEEEAAAAPCFVPLYGPPPPGLCGPFRDPLLAAPRGFTAVGADAATRGLSAAWGRRVTAEEAEKNAMELLAEEERAKRKAEKKKLKKKKQKDRRKQEKLEQEQRSKQAAGTASLPGAAPGDASGAEEESGCLASSPPQRLQERAEEGVGDLEGIEDELDLSCTFVFKAWQKAGVKLPAPARDKSVRDDAAEPNKRQEGAPDPPLPSVAAPQAPNREPAPLDTNMLEQSLILAGCGYQAAMQGRYTEAVQAFTEAIKLNPREHRLFGNRSYCYEKLQRYQEALRDAQMALRLQPNWSKGLFRKGKALWGLKCYTEARSTFEQLLRLEGAHADVAMQMEACQMLLQQSSLQGASSPRDVPVQEAGEPLTPSSAGECANGSCSDVDTSGFVTVVNSRSHLKSHVRTTAPASPTHTLPAQHPARDCYPLWVGNITFTITKKVLQSCFGRFGQIHSIRTLPEKRCAFVNFQQKAAAEAAYGAMLGAELEGCRLALQLKHPSHATPPPRLRP